MEITNGVVSGNFHQVIPVARFAPGSPFEGLANSRLPIRVFRKGTWICTQGETPDCLYIVQEGTVLLSRMSANGQETILGFAKPGDFFGEVPLLTGDAASFNALALKPCVLLVVRNGEFKALLEEPEACRALIEVLARRCTDAWTQIEALGCGPVEERLRSILSWLCNKMGIRTLKGIRINVTQSQLAQMVGTTRESLNRTIGILKHQGILQVSSGSRRTSMLILAPERLPQVQQQPLPRKLSALTPLRSTC